MEVKREEEVYDWSNLDTDTEGENNENVQGMAATTRRRRINVAILHAGPFESQHSLRQLGPALHGMSIDQWSNEDAIMVIFKGGRSKATQQAYRTGSALKAAASAVEAWKRSFSFYPEGLIWVEKKSDWSTSKMKLVNCFIEHLARIHAHDVLGFSSDYPIKVIFHYPLHRPDDWVSVFNVLKHQEGEYPEGPRPPYYYHGKAQPIYNYLFSLSSHM